MDTCTEAFAERPGPARDVMAVRTRPLRLCRSGFVRVRMRLATINPSDLITISGAYSRTVFPFVPGFEGVGEVEWAPANSRLRVGTRVIPIRGAGAWATHRDVRDDDCLVVPDGISDEQACSAFVNPLTALHLVEEFVEGTAPVVVTAASSTTADHLAALLARRGPSAVGVVRSRSSRVRRPPLWRSIIRLDEVGWQERLRREADGSRLLFDCVGGDVAIDVASRLGGRPARLVSYGLLSGRAIPVDTLPEGIRLDYYHLRSRIYDHDRSLLRRQFATVVENIRDGTLVTVDRGAENSREFQLEEVGAALAWHADPGGKTLIRL
jgi:NADPH:quinone reductase-like Zn-dependent oxidoreductase